MQHTSQDHIDHQEKQIRFPLPERCVVDVFQSPGHNAEEEPGDDDMSNRSQQQTRYFEVEPVELRCPRALGGNAGVGRQRGKESSQRHPPWVHQIGDGIPCSKGGIDHHADARHEDAKPRHAPVPLVEVTCSVF